MHVKDHPKIAFAALVGVFILAFALSLYFSGQAEVGTAQSQPTQVTISSNGTVHVLYVQDHGYCNETYVIGSSSVHVRCFYHN